MDIEELNLRAVNLKERFKGINGWIENNLNTDPNFCEIVDCMVEFGKLDSLYADYFDKNGYPFFEEKGRNATNFEIPEVSSEMRAAQEELRKMLNLRSNSAFFKDSITKNFMEELGYKTAVGGYENPDNEEIAALKKDVLCQLAAIYFYIWQTQQREPDYQYDNMSEWNELKNKYNLYKEAVGVQESVKDDDKIYEGPQFGKIIEEMMAGVEKNSILAKKDVVENELDSSLKLQAVDLKNRFEGINGWIENNLNTDPNFCEMVDCTVEYGKLYSQYNDYYMENGYPVLEVEGREATRYEIAVVNPEIMGAQGELYKMMQLRGNHEFFKEPVARGFMNELAYAAATGEYRNPEDSQISAIKKEILCQTAAIYFYIWQTQQREPWYKYDNVSEWTALNEKYAVYKELVGVQEQRKNEDYSIYEGPQFGRIIEDMLNEIQKSYIHQDTFTTGTHK